MSERVQTKARRDLRRAVGADALKVIEAQGRQIDLLTQTVAGQGRELNRLAGVSGAHALRQDQHARQLSNNHAAALDAADALRSRSFRDRVRWLLTGQ
jgi:hypothetical protein